jgi:hypothetical protein
MGKVLNLEGMELEKAYNNFFAKIKEIKAVLESMEDAYSTIDLAGGDDKTLKTFLYSDMMLDSAMVAFNASKEGLEEMLTFFYFSTSDLNSLVKRVKRPKGLNPRRYDT